MRIALADSGLAPEDIDYVSAHGTSTPLNDPIETKAIKAAFGDHARKLKISSLKSMTGHCIGAAGAIESIASILGMNEGYVHPTINYENPDPECDLNYTPNTAREMKVDAILNNALGFGGHNCSLVAKRFV